MEDEPEPIIEPDRPIIDSHHHLWLRPGSRYLLDEYLADVNTGHNIVASVYIQCQSMLRHDGPESLRCIGETEFANGVAAMAASGAFGKVRVNAAIVSHADLMLGAAVRPVLERQIAAGGGRFRGIRYPTVWDADPSLLFRQYPTSPTMMRDTRFREGFACLGDLGLSFDAIVLHPQLPELQALADAFPEVPVILNHIGIPTRIGPYAAPDADVFATWKRNMSALATCSNVSVKLGGLGMHWVGLPFIRNERQASSAELAKAWRPYVETCIEAFGSERCMFESNFPPEKEATGFRALWNAMKLIVADASEEEKTALFFGTAARVYRLN